MTKKKSTKRALLLSALSLLLCVSMLIGTTYAWFTDSVSSMNNIIKSGNLDVELEYLNGNDWEKVTESTNVFEQDTLWEPGHTEVVYLRVSNLGSLALKYELGVNIVSEIKSVNVAGEELVLSDYIEFAAIEGVKTEYASREAARAAVTESAILSAGYTKTGNMEAGDEAQYVALVVYMPETVGNEANHRSGASVPQITLGINLLATQYTSEADSFGNDYDADAVLGTYVELNPGDDFMKAMANAEAGMPLTIKLNTDVEWPTEGHHGENDITPASALTIDGNGHTITATGAGVTPLGDLEAPMTLKNVKIVDNSVSYNESAWELSYLEMGGRKLNCVNVDFADPITVDGDDSTFTDCSFVGHYDKNSTSTTQYGVWVSNGDAAFINCTFSGTRGLKICDQYDSEVGTVVVDGCTFSNISEKPGVAIDDRDTLDMNITIKNSTFINCQAGDQGLYIYETDNTTPTLENNIVESYAELVEIATKEQLVAFANRVNGGDGMSGVMVKLTDDIDLAGMEWIPVGQTGTSYGATSYFKGIFDGQGHTISNMTITQTNDGKNYAAGFFGFIDGAAVTVRNVTFDKANVSGHHWTGVVAGYLTGNIEKCTVTNSTVTCTHANDDACGDKAGAVVGYINSGLVNNCSATGCTITAGRDAGQIVGASKTAYVANCTATDVTVSAYGDCTGANINNAIIGRVL